IATHVRGCTVTLIEPRQSSGGEDRRLGGDDTRRARAQLQRECTSDFAVDYDEIDHAEITRLANDASPVDNRPQCFGDSRSSIDEIDIDAARTIVPGRCDLRDATVLACPADAPCIEFPDAFGAFLPQQAR